MSKNLKRKLNKDSGINEDDKNNKNNNNNDNKIFPNVLDSLFIVNPFYIKFNTDNLLLNENNILSNSINLIEIVSKLDTNNIDSSEWTDKIKNNLNLLIIHKMFHLTKKNSDKQIKLEFKYLHEELLNLVILNDNENNNINNILSNCNIIKAKIKSNNSDNPIDLCTRLFFPLVDSNLNNSNLYLNNAKLFSNEEFKNCGTFNCLSSSILDENLKFYMSTDSNAYKLLNNTTIPIGNILKLGTKILTKEDIDSLMEGHLYGPKIIPDYDSTKGYLDKDKMILFSINHLMFHFIYTKKKNDISFNQYNLNFDDTVDNFIIIKLSLFDSIVTEITKYINNTYNTPQNLNLMKVKIFEDDSIYNLMCDQFIDSLNQFKTFNLNLSLDILIESFDYKYIDNKIPGFIDKFYEKEVIDKLILETSLANLIIS